MDDRNFSSRAFFPTTGDRRTARLQEKRSGKSQTAQQAQALSTCLCPSARKPRGASFSSPPNSESLPSEQLFTRPPPRKGHRAPQKQTTHEAAGRDVWERPLFLAQRHCRSPPHAQLTPSPNFTHPPAGWPPAPAPSPCRATAASRMSRRARANILVSLPCLRHKDRVW
jgi:hypothetical protein